MKACSLAQTPSASSSAASSSLDIIGLAEDDFFGSRRTLSVFSADLIYFISLCRGPVVRGMVRPPQGVQGSHFGVIWGHLKKYVFDRVFASFYVRFYSWPKWCLARLKQVVAQVRLTEGARNNCFFFFIDNILTVGTFSESSTVVKMIIPRPWCAPLHSRDHGVG